jgi:hypothetical protein
VPKPYKSIDTFDFWKSGSSLAQTGAVAVAVCLQSKSEMMVVCGDWVGNKVWFFSLLSDDPEITSSHYD